MNYSTQVGKPTAHITKKKSRLKVYNGHIVFLNDKDNFEFEIHNPKQSSVLCKIKLNGQYISNSGVVVKPGQRLFLERFLDSNNKFEFSTYEVKNTSENRSAIDLNGDVIIEFYDEGSTSYYPHLSGGNWGNGWTTINTGSPYYGNMTFTTSGLNGTVTTNTSSYFSKSIETGRVEKGEESNQSFVYDNSSFNSFPIYTNWWKIKPNSTKVMVREDLVVYCTECGSKRKKDSHKFCPHCGTKY